MATMLWIDDDYDVLSGLGAYLEEVEDLRLLRARAVVDARKLLHDNMVDLLLFDMVLMDDSFHASLDRTGGIHLASEAIAKKVKRFVAYTVLSEGEVTAAWENTVKKVHGNSFVFKYYPKGGTTVLDVVAGIKNLLGLRGGA